MRWVSVPFGFRTLSALNVPETYFDSANAHRPKGCIPWMKGKIGLLLQIINEERITTKMFLSSEPDSRTPLAFDVPRFSSLEKGSVHSHRCETPALPQTTPIIWKRLWSCWANTVQLWFSSENNQIPQKRLWNESKCWVNDMYRRNHEKTSPAVRTI